MAKISSNANISSILLAESAAPDTPASGYFQVYASTDGKLYGKNDAGTVVCFSDLLSNPMTTAGDIIYGSTDGVPARLAKGTASQVLTMNSGATAPEWAASSGGGGTYSSDILKDETLSTAGRFSYTVDTGYDFFEVIIIGRVGTNDINWMAIEINDDTTAANYSRCEEYYGSEAGNSFSQASFGCGAMAANNSPSGFYGVNHIYIYDPDSTTKKKVYQFKSFTERTGNAGYIEEGFGYWESTNAITKIEFAGESGGTLYDFAAGSQILVIGHKSA